VQRRPGPVVRTQRARVLAHLLVVQSRGFEGDVEQIDQILKEGSHWFASPRPDVSEGRSSRCSTDSPVVRIARLNSLMSARYGMKPRFLAGDQQVRTETSS
jgi:hypothetical protein